MALFKGIIQLTTEQFNELKTNGYITIQGQRIDYDPVSTLYLTPQGSNITMDDQDNSAAIGNNSNALGENAVQLGAGTNTTPNTLQFLNLTVVDADGQIPNDRLTRIIDLINNSTVHVDSALDNVSGNPVANSVITNEINNINSTISSQSNDISNLNTNVGNLQTDVSSLQTQIGDIDILLTNLNTGGGV